MYRYMNKLEELIEEIVSDESANTVNDFCERAIKRLEELIEE